MVMSRMFIFSKNISKIYKINNTINKINNINAININRYYTTVNNGSQFDKLLQKLDESIKEAKIDDEKHQSVVDIANQFLKNKYSFYENSLFLSKICKYHKLKPEYWNDYLNKLNEMVLSSKFKYRESELRESKESLIKENETKENKYNDLNLLCNISKSLITAKLVSKPLASVFIKLVMRDVFNIIPSKAEIFNSLLDYLVHCDYKEKLPQDVFDMVIEFAHKMKPFDLIHMMYCFGRLDQRNDEMVQTVARVLHNNISKGLLTPYEKTKLAKAYSLMNYEHITFFNHMSKELMVMFNKMDFGNFFKNEMKEWYDNGNDKDKDKDVDKHKKNDNKVQKNDNNDSIYSVGVGSTKCKPSGVMVDVLKYIHLYSSDNKNIDKEEPKSVEFLGNDDQIYTCGQMMYILDSMIYLRLHHLEPEFKKLVNYAIKHLFKVDVVKYFDSEQIRCCITLLATCRKTVDDQLLELMTKRFVRDYLDGNATNSQLSLFLKDLVKLTKVVVKRRNVRNKLLYNSNFIPPKWINNPLDDNANLMDPTSSRSIIEHLCYKICDNVNTFNMNDLSSCLRSVAYLGYRNEKFYSVFIPFFRQNMESMNNVSVSNITQSFNKAGIKDKYFFYLLGKQHQLYLHELVDKEQIKRIG